MKNFFVLLTLLTLISSVSAYVITFNVRDFNTLNPIENVNITVRHSTSVENVYTDSYGYALRYDDADDYFYNMTVTGYYPLFDSFVNVTNDTYVGEYLTPISTEGLVRIIWTDDTLNMPSRRICVFYSDNGRLAGCYLKNETIWLLNNHAYIFEPETNFYDSVTSIDGIWENRYDIIPYIGLILIILTLLVATVKKR